MKNNLKVIFVILILSISKSFCMETPNKQSCIVPIEYYQLLENHAKSALNFYKKINFDSQLLNLYESNLFYDFASNNIDAIISNKFELNDFFKETFLSIIKNTNNIITNNIQGPELYSFLIYGESFITFFLNDLGFKLPEILINDAINDEPEQAIIKNTALNDFVRICIEILKDTKLDLDKTHEEIKNSIKDDFERFYHEAISKFLSVTHQEKDSSIQYYSDIVDNICFLIRQKYLNPEYVNDIFNFEITLKSKAHAFKQKINKDLQIFKTAKFVSWYKSVALKLNNKDNLNLLFMSNSENIKKFDSLLEELKIQKFENCFSEEDCKKINDDFERRAVKKLFKKSYT